MYFSVELQNLQNSLGTILRSHTSHLFDGFVQLSGRELASFVKHTSHDFVNKLLGVDQRAVQIQNHVRHRGETFGGSRFFGSGSSRHRRRNLLGTQSTIGTETSVVFRCRQNGRRHAHVPIVCVRVRSGVMRRHQRADSEKPETRKIDLEFSAAFPEDQTAARSSFHPREWRSWVSALRGLGFLTSPSSAQYGGRRDGPAQEGKGNLR